VVERYPTRSVISDGNRLQVELTIVSEEWLAELLLRLGPSATVLAPHEWSGLGAVAAADVLARYEAAGSSAS
jgi:predicted DNA-binding transcriptional regulator YafY